MIIRLALYVILQPWRKSTIDFNDTIIHRSIIIYICIYAVIYVCLTTRRFSFLSSWTAGHDYSFYSSSRMTFRRFQMPPTQPPKKPGKTHKINSRIYIHILYPGQDSLDPSVITRRLSDPPVPPRREAIELIKILKKIK